MAVKLHILDGSGWMQQRGAKIGIGTDISGPYMWLGMADDGLLHPGFAPTPEWLRGMATVEVENERGLGTLQGRS